MRILRLLLPFLILALATAQIGRALHWFGRDPNAGTTIGGPFQLSDSRGKTVTDRDFLGKWMLVYFGYTQCPDFCPATLNAIAGALRELGPLDDKLAAVFVTIDPKRDTQSVVGRYTAQFDPRIVGLTGTPDQTLAIENAYHVAAPSPNYATPNSTGLEAIEHSSAIIVMNPAGAFAAIIPGNADAHTIASRLRSVMR